MRISPQDIAVFLIYGLLSRTAGYIPLWLLRGGCRIAFVFLYPIVGFVFRLRRRIARNIRAAYGQSLSMRKAKTMARRVLYNQLFFFMELFFYYHPRNRELFRESVSIEGKEHLAVARKVSPGIIGVSAHLGNFQLMMLRLALEDNTFAALIKNPKSKFMSEAWIGYMESFGLKSIMIRHRVSAIKQIVRELRHSAFIMFVADEYSRRAGHIVTFFDKNTSMAAGPAQLSLRLNVPIVPCFIIREAKSRYRIVIERPIEITRTGDYEADSRSLTQKRIDILEKYIRLYPEQWLWTQTRWKKKTLRKQ